jgi:Tol biopolymer transport system component
MDRKLFTLLEIGLIIGLIAVVLYLGGVFDLKSQPTATSLATVPFFTPTPRLTPTPAPTFVAPSLVEPSGLIAFNTTGLGNQEIFTINVQTGEVRNLTQNLADDYLLAWSPDGSRLAFFSTRTDWLELYVTTADGSEVIQLTNTKGTQTAYEPPVTWSPDGTFLIAARSSPWNMRQGQLATYIDRIQSDGSGFKTLLGRPEQLDLVSLSPDGQYIALISQGTDGYGIYANRLTAEGLTEPKYLANCGLYTWIPPNRLACNYIDPFLTVNADGSDEQTFSVSQGSATTFNMVWSPDGQQALFETGFWQSASNSFGDLSLSLLRPGYPPRPLTDLDNRDIVNTFDFAWAPDNQWIAFTSHRPDEQDVVILNVYNPRDVRYLTNTLSGDGFAPQWQPQPSQ